MSDRYFCETPICSDRVVLTGPEAHHLLHVMRAGPETEVVLFDGSGAEFHAVVRKVGRSDVELTVLSRQEVDRELRVELHLGVALPKGDRQKWLVEKAVELGVSRLVPLATARGVAQPVDQAVARLRRAVVEASKQCGRNRLMEVAAPQSWDDFVAAGGDCCRLLAHPLGRASPVPSVLASRRVLLAVGPEGGLTDEEVALATAASWQLIDLGPRILRVETAALALAAIVAQRSCIAGNRQQ